MSAPSFASGSFADEAAALVKAAKKCTLHKIEPLNTLQEDKGYFLKMVCDVKEKVETKDLSSLDQAGTTGELIAALHHQKRSISKQCTKKTLSDKNVEECPIVSRDKK